MKIVSYDEFVRMPAGTVFAPYEPCVFKEAFSVKTDTGEMRNIPFVGPMWCFLGVMPLRPWLGDCDLTVVGERVDASFETYDGSQNDYDKDEMFVVLENSDIDRLINALTWAKNGCVGKPNCSVEDREEVRDD